jgi:DNA-binding transcriptional ArsR family regulator
VTSKPDIGDPAVIRALSHPLRVQILGVLEERVASPAELSRELEEPLPNVSYHVRILADMGLLTLVSETPRRGAIEHHYKATLRPVITDAAWKEVPKLVRRSVVAAVADRLANDLVEAAPGGGLDRTDIHASRTELQLDAKAWKELSVALENVVDKALRLEAASKKRAGRGKQPAELMSGRLGMLLFERPE